MSKSTFADLLPAAKPLNHYYLPREWERDYGYLGNARYIGIYWSRAGDEASWTDGWSSCCGANWHTYLELMPLLFRPEQYAERYALGHSDEDPTHMLLLDLSTRVIYYTPFNLGHRFLAIVNTPVALNDKDADMMPEHIRETLSLITLRLTLPVANDESEAP